MAKIRITQVRSLIGRPESQKATMRTLRLGKINRQVVLEATPTVLGMCKAISHLVKIEIVE
ncbi:MAG: 50S ribosomal protein L30 [Bacteroidia bacterium]|nr:50S ribosomal protein L30 [Bacteroidia bacterium]